jgi:hypothetical protein
MSYPARFFLPLFTRNLTEVSSPDTHLIHDSVQSTAIIQIPSKFGIIQHFACITVFSIAIGFKVTGIDIICW